MENRELLLKRIQVCDFVLLDAALYLDTHPDDKQALEFYKKHLDMRNAAASEYILKYGPLKHMDYDGGARWNWVDGKWPWQLEEEKMHVDL